MLSAKKMIFVQGGNDRVYDRVVFDQQPQTQVISGSSATFSVSASSVPAGLPLTYQWYRLPKSSGDGVILTGETARTLNLSGMTLSANDGDSYRVKVTVGGSDPVSYSSSAAHLYLSNSTLLDFGEPRGLYACGLNSQQSLGDPADPDQRSWMVRTLGGTISEISAGARHGFAIKSDGSLWGWGEAMHTVGLGSWDSTPVLSPTRVGSENSWLQVGAGGDFTLAIKSNGSLWAWGNVYGSSLSNPFAGYGNAPVQVDGGNWSKVSVGGGVGKAHMLAIKSDGSLWVWGQNNRGQLGLGDTDQRTSMVRVGSSTWTQVSGGYEHTLAIKSDGTLWGWGYNFAGQVGDGTSTNRSSPVMIDGSSWSKVAAGLSHSLAIKSDGTLWAWGVRIGDGTVSGRSNTPKMIDSGSWLEVSPAGFSSCAIKSDGTLWTWGENAFGELSNNFIPTSQNVLSPTQVDSGYWTKISGGLDMGYFLVVH